ncbi:hypothetical protein IE4872_PC00318 (plasmid) [Rhizobium gallicum]|uniref:Uncharacterized protein n=1 Tax=Rhizobium gallicum TaxID=56730 RepID=A0A1L5NR15_9HYPH|nr:hypothetical protein IE4872_PC00318 [Rhizobium gallicum]
MALLSQFSPSCHSGSPLPGPVRRPITACTVNKLGGHKGGLGMLDQRVPPPCVDQAIRNLEAAGNFGNHRAWCESLRQYLRAIFQ